MGAVLMLSSRPPQLNLRFCARWPGQIIGTALPASVDYRSADWTRPCILLMGNEQAGLPDR